jgi:hypothetical protein
MTPKRQLQETTSQLDLARVEASVQQSAGQRTRRFELFAELFRGLSSGRGSVGMAWRVKNVWNIRVCLLRLDTI